MGFDIYRIEPLEPNRFTLHRLRSLPMGGVSGLLAKHLPAMAASNENWTLSAQEVLKLAGVDDTEGHGVFFDLSQTSADQVNLFELISVSGRTVSIITDALFHFKVACVSRNRAEISGPNGEISVSDWHDKPTRFEQLRLEGGTRGGNWAWSEPPQGASATVL